MAESLGMSTPIILTVVLGVVGLAIPVIDGLRKERGGSNKLYSAISFGTLIFAIGFVIARVLSGEVMPAMSFGPGVLSNDVFGSFFATAFLIVSIMVTVSSWNYMKGKTNPAALLFTNSFVYHRHGADCILYGPSHVACILGIDVSPNLCTRRLLKKEIQFLMKLQSITLCLVRCRQPYL